MGKTTPEAFRASLSSWPSGVTVVTTKHDDAIYGLTVSSFSSLSLDPPLVLVCLANGNRLPSMIQQSGHFAISILADDQEEIAAHFARPGRVPVDRIEEFDTIDWHTGSPIIAGSAAHLDCELHELLPGGDHSIAVGSVIGAAASLERPPLIYLRRAYRKLAAGC